MRIDPSFDYRGAAGWEFQRVQLIASLQHYLGEKAQAILQEAKDEADLLLEPRGQYLSRRLHHKLHRLKTGDNV